MVSWLGLRALAAGTEGLITACGNKILETIQYGICVYIYIYHGLLRLKGIQRSGQQAVA